MDTCAELDYLVRRALGDDARSALGAVRCLAADQLPWLEQRAVRLARRDGMSWARIGRLLDLSPQTAHRRFRHLDDHPPRPPKPVGWCDPGAEANREFHRIKRDQRLASELAAWEASGHDIVPW